MIYLLAREGNLPTWCASMSANTGCPTGAIVVLGSLAILFELLPWLWWNVFGPRQSATGSLDVGSMAVLVIVGTVVAIGLIVLAARLLGPEPVPGVKAGIFTTLVLLLFVLLLTPPMVQLNTPYPATAYLMGFLRLHAAELGLELAQADPALELFLRLYSRDGLTRMRDTIKPSGAAAKVAAEASKTMPVTRCTIASQSSAVKIRPP